MPGSHSTTASNPFLTPQHRRGGDERKQRAYTHTHTYGVCSIYSKASRALARCTKRKLSCRPEINYRVSRGWIRKGWFLCCNNALRAANLRKYHLDSFGFGQREFFQLCRIYNVTPFLNTFPFFSRGWYLKGWRERESFSGSERLLNILFCCATCEYENDGNLLLIRCCFRFQFYLRNFVLYERISRRGSYVVLLLEFFGMIWGNSEI